MPCDEEYKESLTLSCARPPLVHNVLEWVMFGEDFVILLFVMLSLAVSYAVIFTVRLPLTVANLVRTNVVR